MNLVWDHWVSTKIQDLGYDVNTRAVVFSDKPTAWPSPVPYDVYSAILHSANSARVYRQAVKEIIPQLPGYKAT